MSKHLEQTPYWQRFFAGYEPVKEWRARVDPDIAIVVYNDHGLNFFLDKVPTIALGRALRNAIETLQGGSIWHWRHVASVAG